MRTRTLTARFAAAALPLTAVLLAPAAASAATADADVRLRDGARFGPVTFRAAPGEVNRLTVTSTGGRLVFRDPANRVEARGDCEQLGRHAARCPYTEDIADAHLGDRGDRADVGTSLVDVHGGRGDDLLRGSQGRQTLLGDAGDDVVHGLRGGDHLTGGPGRDRVYGGSGDDDLLDGETDRRAAPDLFRGGTSQDTIGADRGDVIDYGLRRRPVRIDLARGRTNTGDRILGLESIVGGSGADRLRGDGDDNILEGRGGDDLIRGRRGADIPIGGRGDDDVAGGSGDDVVWGNSGRDGLSGGSGDDLLISRDGQAEDVACGRGDDVVRSNPTDRLRRDCETATASTLTVQVQPAIAGGEATFRVACGGRPGGCSGSLAVSSLAGERYGSADFAGLPDDPQVFSDVTVPLTPAGTAALREGAVVQVTFGRFGGYRAFLQGG